MAASKIVFINNSSFIYYFMGDIHRMERAKKLLVLTGIALAVLSSRAAAEEKSHASSERVEYSQLQYISPEDSDDIVVEKAAKVLPRANQSAWMRLERTFFLHFGPNTFRGVEWGNGKEDPAIFNPTALDANQWVSAIKNAGGKLMILVSKHHDGFCLWPTRYTPHSVAASPWLDGKGDVVRAATEAAHAQGVKIGIYLSPADLYQLRTNPVNPAGYYGNGSRAVPSTIPTDPQHFQDDPKMGRTPAPGIGSFVYTVDDYNRYFLNQLYELLTEYGPISVVWFDGANPDPSVHQQYDYAAWYDMIRRLQPEAVISVKGPDVRWVGNEGGIGRMTEWSVIPLQQPPDRNTWPDLQNEDLGSRAKLKAGSYLWWYPAEVNTPILYGWFWSADKPTKSAADLVDYFYTSVGRNGVMLLNLSPDTRGLIPDNQLTSLAQMSDVVNQTFAADLADGAQLVADTSAPLHSASSAHDHNLDTWWEAAQGQAQATITVSLPAPRSFDVVSLQEAVDQRSQRIESFEIDIWKDGYWIPAQVSEQQTTVGRKRLLRLVNAVQTDQLRVKIFSSRLEPTLSEIGLFKQALPEAPVISRRSRDGAVTITHQRSLPVVYTLDGTEPVPTSPIYKQPLSVSSGGTIKAALLTPEGLVGLVASRTEVGLVPKNWSVVRVEGTDEEGSLSASNVIDADPTTDWKAHAAGGSTHPSVTIDLGKAQVIAGFVYVPPQNWQGKGLIDQYRLETSLDGKEWFVAIADGEFGNLRNNRVLQLAKFAPVQARYFRFTALRSVDNDSFYSAAEITVLPVIK
ncbi:MAG TPA: alpha-L-fucosidase [Opitutaceae bacterium]